MNENIVPHEGNIEKFKKLEIGESILFEDPQKGISFANAVRDNGNVKTKTVIRKGERLLRVWRIK